jgi:hypothetical protein
MSFGQDATFVAGCLIAITLGSLVFALALIRVFPDVVAFGGLAGALTCGTGAYLFLPRMNG